MGLWTEQVVPRLVDLGMRGEHLSRERRKVLEGVSGSVLEIGFGSGLNLPWYGPGVERLLALDPSPLARRLSARRVAAAPFPVEFVGEVGEAVPLEDGSVDAVVSTWTLCTIPDVARALAEARRVLRPGGRLHFVEHGLSDDPRVVRWQQRLNGLQGRCFGGCQLVRPVDRLVREAGFELEDLERFDARGPRALTHFYRGRGLRR